MKPLLLILAAAALYAQDPAPVTPWQMLTPDPNTGLLIPCSGCTINTYAAGTNTPLAVYTDSTLMTANTNPVQTNSAGWVVNGNSPSTITGIWIGSACYKFVAKNAGGTMLWSQDNVCDSGQIAKLFSQTATYPAGTVGLKLQQTINLQDYGGVADGSTSNNSAFAAAMSAQAARGGGNLQITPLKSGETYAVTSAISVPSGVVLDCGKTATIKNTQAHGGVLTFNNVTNSGVNNCTLVAANGSPVQPVDSTSGNAILINGGGSLISVTGNDISGHEFGGVNIDNASFLTISGNNFHGGWNSSAATTQPEGSEVIAWGTMNNSLISNNVMTSYNDIGIELGPNTTNTSAANDNVLDGNQIQNKNVYAMVLYGDASNTGQVVLRNIVSNNQVQNISSRVTNASGSNGGECVYAVATQFTIITHNQCFNTMINRVNTVLPTGTISVSDSIQSQVTDNIVETSAWDGIWASNASISDPVGTVISGNVVSGAAQIGVHVNTSARATISANGVSASGAEGINVDVSSDVTVTGNRVSHSGTHGIYNLSNSAIFSGNTSEFNNFDGFFIGGNNILFANNIGHANSQSPTGTYSGTNFSGSNGLQATSNYMYDDQGSPTQKYGYSENGTYGGTITGCTNASPAVCTVASSAVPSTTSIILSGFAGAWSTMNGAKAATHLSGSTFSVPVDSTGFSTLVGLPVWRSVSPLSLTGNCGYGNTATTFSLIAPLYSASQNCGFPDIMLIGPRQYLSYSSCAQFNASPAVCGDAIAGTVTVSASATTEVVNTTKVTATSQIMLLNDPSGQPSNVCNSSTPPKYWVVSRVPGVSFTIQVDSAPSVNPLCLDFTIEN